ncbi:MAG: type II restriction endonuclease [Treponema sp.]|jgi:hypothetical protein|nr:type II restriction endonuclease [Treponema sp.]
MTGYIKQHSSTLEFLSGNSWVILNPIEKRIKEKIERVGTPLKDWDISINYGIKTGCNEAFIIDKTKRDELIAKNKKSAEIIHPILRGRDIKRYGYEFAEQYIIATFPSRKYDIDDYPAVRDYLLKYGKQKLEQSGKPGARKKTSHKWFETQDPIAYWDDFSKQKIFYPDITERLSFCISDEEIYCNNTAYFLVSNTENLEYILMYLNSDLINWYYKTLSVQLGETAVRMFSIYVLNIPIPKNGDEDIFRSYKLTKNEIEFILSISYNS